ncbi:hypothetical protein LCGC14_1596900 [marine sediment metagenome]|uniref:Uncharacterized protein n=1 Tax=marine sediment metagenome TaxID=412755 RepID=A0A0F9IYQ1_9ZZZZ
MDQVRNQLEEMGCMCEDWTDEKCNEVAKVLGIAVPPKPREMKLVVGKNGADYLVTEGFPVPKYKDQKQIPGETSMAKNVYTRIESVPQLIKDLTAGYEQFTK